MGASRSFSMSMDEVFAPVVVKCRHDEDLQRQNVDT
jgi:hypothetical protein